MTFATDDTTKSSVEKFQQFDVDTQLGLLWFGYLDLKKKLTPANSASAQNAAGALFDQFKTLSHEEQLQAQRDIAGKADTDISRTYSSLSSSGKLGTWLRLAQGMEDGTIIPMPSDYKLPDETQDFVAQIQKLEFDQRIDFMRSVVIEMGCKA
jgi:hypothetical protein